MKENLDYFFYFWNGTCIIKGTNVLLEMPNEARTTVHNPILREREC